MQPGSGRGRGSGWLQRGYGPVASAPCGCRNPPEAHAWQICGARCGRFGDARLAHCPFHGPLQYFFVAVAAPDDTGCGSMAGRRDVCQPRLINLKHLPIKNRSVLFPDRSRHLPDVARCVRNTSASRASILCGRRLSWDGTNRRTQSMYASWGV